MKKNKQNFRKLWEIKYTNTCNRNTSRKKKNQKGQNIT